LPVFAADGPAAALHRTPKVKKWPTGMGIIRQVPGLAAVPILAMTANDFADDRDRCLAAGMNGHIGKPVEPNVLYSTLMQWLPKTSNPKLL
jgi:CheY-like chemotaxis protein